MMESLKAETVPVIVSICRNIVQTRGVIELIPLCLNFPMAESLQERSFMLWTS